MAGLVSGCGVAARASSLPEDGAGNKVLDGTEWKRRIDDDRYYFHFLYYFHLPCGVTAYRQAVTGQLYSQYIPALPPRLTASHSNGFPVYCSSIIAAAYCSSLA